METCRFNPALVPTVSREVSQGRGCSSYVTKPSDCFNTTDWTRNDLVNRARTYSPAAALSAEHWLQQELAGARMRRLICTPLKEFVHFKRKTDNIVPRDDWFVIRV